jgi:predicted RNA-binding protein with PUA-like domain
MQYWLVKSEPESYSWEDLKVKKEDLWDGVRNYQARNFMKEMKLGDQVLFYHSGKEKSVVGVAEVTKEFYLDPHQGNDDRWVSVNLKAKNPLLKKVSLEEIKKTNLLKEVYLIRQSRLSVMPLKQVEFEKIIEMGN